MCFEKTMVYTSPVLKQDNNKNKWSTFPRMLTYFISNFKYKMTTHIYKTLRTAEKKQMHLIVVYSNCSTLKEPGTGIFVSFSESFPLFDPESSSLSLSFSLFLFFTLSVTAVELTFTVLLFFALLITVGSFAE